MFSVLLCLIVLRCDACVCILYWFEVAVLWVF